MLTDRGTGLIGAGVALWMASRTFGVAELQMAAVAAFALVGLAVAFTSVTSSTLGVYRTARPARLFAGDEGEVELAVTNTGRLPTAYLDVHDQAPLSIAEGSRVALRPLRPGERTAVRYRLRGEHRGRFQLGPLTVRLRDPFGLVAREHVLPGTAEVVVYPAVWRLPEGVPLGGTTTAGGGGRPRPLPSGEDLANVREYVRGDDLRTVHWPTTAHRGKLMVRQVESPQDPRGVVLLDVRAARHAGHGPAASIEAAVTAAASTIHHLAARGRSVTLLDRPVAKPPPGLPWESWLERLADIEPADVDLPALLRQVAQGVGGDGALVAVLTMPSADELRELVRAGRGFSTRLALLVDAPTYAGRRGGSADPVVGALRMAGWRVSVLSAGDRLDERWRELILHRRVREAVG
jgi:uncharacterized protein (DUF58 family)